MNKILRRSEGCLGGLAGFDGWALWLLTLGVLNIKIAKGSKDIRQNLTKCSNVRCQSVTKDQAIRLAVQKALDGHRPEEAFGLKAHKVRSGPTGFHKGLKRIKEYLISRSFEAVTFTFWLSSCRRKGHLKLAN